MGRLGTQCGLVLTAALASACFVDIQHVKDPLPLFKKERAEAMKHQGEPGPAHELHVLVFDPANSELVRVSLPMGLLRKLDRDKEWDEDFDEEGGHDRVRRHIERHLRLKDLEKADLGVLVEVEEDSGERVLIWLR